MNAKLNDKQVALVGRLMTQIGAHETSIRELVKVIAQLPEGDAGTMAVRDLASAARALSDATDALAAYRDNPNGEMDDDLEPGAQS